MKYKKIQQVLLEISEHLQETTLRKSLSAFVLDVENKFENINSANNRNYMKRINKMKLDNMQLDDETS